MADFSKKLGFIDLVSRGRLLGGSNLGLEGGSKEVGSMSESVLMEAVESGGSGREAPIEHRWKGAMVVGDSMGISTAWRSPALVIGRDCGGAGGRIVSVARDT